MRVNKYWLLYFFVKLFYMCFGILVYSKVTKLGDTSRWMDGTSPYSFSLKTLYDSTYMMDFIGGISSRFLGELLGNLPFMILAFYGVYYSLSKIQLSKKELIVSLFMLSLPSFGVWSSVAGKEAAGVFFMGIILGFMIDLSEKKKSMPNLIELIAIYLLIIFKPQYFIAVISGLFFIFLRNRFNLSGKMQFLLLLIHIAIGVMGLYAVKDLLNEVSYILPRHFSMDGGSTRENNIWVNEYDIFYNAPYGMFIGFWGPTLKEVASKPLQMVVFIESCVVMLFFVYNLLIALLSSLKSGMLNMYILSLSAISFFWLLFVHYPFGVMNPGSALRYRENFYGFLIVLVIYMGSKHIAHYNKRTTVRSL